ncbi:ATP-binding protein [Methanolobus sp. WCC5]|uniref:ATP-binding protein n=1 Tax=Methanolobus sp. WCC5 TaxID=3125785 RepID=UPI00324E08DD
MDEWIESIVAAGEGYHIEFKESLDKSFVEEVCAFANSNGGKVFLGISDKGIIKGVQTDNSFRSRVQDSLRQLQPQLDVKIEVHDNFIVADVPEGSEKPYACSRGFFLRNGANSQKLNRNEIIAFFQKEGRIRFEELRNGKADFENDFDERAFRNFLKLAGITSSIDKMALLRNLDCVTDDGKLNNAGVLFFAKDIDFLLNHAIVVCVLYKGTKKVNILDKKDFKENIVENIDNAILFVKRHTNVEYRIEKIRREEIPDIPDIALREAIINAVCHRDYFDRGSNVLVEVFDDRVEISNPGGLPSGLKPSEFGTRSVARNPLIASLLHRIDYIEKVGTGINRIRQAVDENEKTSVEFSYDGSFSVVFRKRAAGSEIELGDGSEKSSEKILEAIKENPAITREELSQITDLSIRGVEWNLSKLKDEGKIKRIGSRKSGHWEVIE